MLLNRIRKILEIPLVKNTAKLSSSNIFVMLLPLAVTPILSRIYTPADYGDWGVFVSVFYTIQSFLFLSYENTIVKTNRETELPGLIIICLIVALSVISLTYIAFKLGGLFEIQFFKDFPDLSLLIALLLIIMTCTILKSLCNKNRQYGTMAISGVIDGTAQAGIRIFLGLVPIVASGLIVGNVLAQLLTALYLIFVLRKYLWTLDFRKINFSFIIKLAQKYQKFPIYDAPAKLVEIGMGSLPIIILSYFWERSQLGCYSMVITFLLMPISLIGSAMGNVYYKELSENQDSLQIMRNSTVKVAKISFWLSFLPMMFLALGGDKLLVLFLGTKWLDAGKMSLCLSLYSLPVIMSEPLLPIFRIMDKQEIRLRLNVANFVIAMASLMLVPIMSKNIFHTLIIFSVIQMSFRFYLFKKELSLLSLSPSILKNFILITSVCYIIVLSRILGERLIL